MTSIESRSYCRVVVVAPHTKVDVALPAEVTIIDLLPMLLRYTGESNDAAVPTGWKLMRVGHGELAGGRTLRALDVLDGEVLQLVAANEKVPAPIFDDVVDLIASARRDHINTRSSNPGLGAAVIVVAALTAALTVFYRSGTAVNAYLCGAIALVLLGVATAVAKVSENSIISTATASGGIAFAFVCGLDAAAGSDGSFSAWSVLLGAALALVYSLAAILATGTGTSAFTATATGSLFAALTALTTGLTGVETIRIVGATTAIAFGALSVLPRLAMRLARLPMPVVATAGTDPADLRDPADIAARAHSAGDYLTGTQLGCAATIAFSALLLGVHASALSIALAAVVTLAMALRARSVAGLGARIALIGGAAASAAAVAVVLVLTTNSDRHDYSAWSLAVEACVAAITIAISTSATRRPVSPVLLRLIDFVESAAVLAIIPLAAGVLGLYTALRQH